MRINATYLVCRKHLWFVAPKSQEPRGTGISQKAGRLQWSVNPAAAPPLCSGQVKNTSDSSIMATAKPIERHKLRFSVEHKTALAVQHSHLQRSDLTRKQFIFQRRQKLLLLHFIVRGVTRSLLLDSVPHSDP